MAEVLAEMKFEDIVALDMRGVTDFADFFLIATGRSRAQMKAAVDRIQREMKNRGARPFTRPEADSDNWVVLDYGDTLIHLFDAPARARYSLEELWGDAPAVDWRQIASA